MARVMKKRMLEVVGVCVSIVRSYRIGMEENEAIP